MLLAETAFVKEPAERTIEAFVASRSQKGNSGWFYLLVMLLTSLLGGFCAGDVQNFLKNTWHWMPDDAEMAAHMFRAQILVFAFVWIGKLINWTKGHLEIERGEEETFPGNSDFQFWQGATEPKPIAPSMSRILPTLGGFFLGLFLLGLVFFNDSLTAQLAGGIGLIFCACCAYRNVFPRPYPLLVMNEEELKVRKRSLRWKSVHQVQAQHWRDGSNGQISLKLTFRDRNRKKIADVMLTEDQCGIPKEKALLEFLAEVLGGDVKTIAPGR